MEALMDQLFSNIYISFFALLVAFALLVKSADIFVDSAVGISNDFGIPRMIVGIIVVGFGTTAPEIAVSVISAIRGNSEFALGNALGSVIVDDGVALALAALTAPAVIFVDKKILKTTGIFLITIDIIAYILAFNGIINRIEGSVLVLLLIVYFLIIINNEKKRRQENKTSMMEEEIPEVKGKFTKHILMFALGLAGVVIASHIIVNSAEHIALHFGVPNVIVGLTIIAIGTSLPEISTAVIAARKGEGELAAGNILGADILNILWIVGVSSVVNPIDVSDKMIDVSLFGIEFNQIPSVHFSFIWMFIIVLTMLVLMRIKYSLTKMNGIILLTLYLIYFYMNFSMFAG